MAAPFNDTALPCAPSTSQFTTPSGLPQLPPTILDALIPGYSLLAGTVLKHVGIDVSFYVSLCAFAFALHATWNYTFIPFRDHLIKLFSSTVVVDEYDDIYEHILKWLREHTLMADIRSLRAESRGRYYDYEEDDLEETDADSLSTAAGSIFNFRQWSARLPPKYEPHSSSGFFWHKGFFYRITREEKRVQNEWSGMPRDREYLYITCLWRSTRPLKLLIDEARERYMGRQTSHTRIYRPSAPELRSGNNEWHSVSVRPSRPMSTVVLDDGPKAEILLDMNEFLHPKTATWYSNRGIPYRRGYLFHGPPGTGKSSMSFSLAGVFGLNIYCLSLSEISLTEEALIVLFNTLPRRCIVLLEDIDSAGISRPKPDSTEDSDTTDEKQKQKKQPPVATTQPKDLSLPAAAKATKRLVNAISISGLLNAIDGVASSEGRVLIMTTNYPEKLDEALVRPGRVDLKVSFDLASKQQIKELFLRMYSADLVESSRKPTTISEIMPHVDLGVLGAGDDDEFVDELLSQTQPRSEKKKKDNEKAASRPSTPDVKALKSKAVSTALDKLADEFAAALPGNTFSPAEIQGYLLTRKKGARKAVADIGAWSDEMLARKKKLQGSTLSSGKAPAVVMVAPAATAEVQTIEVKNVKVAMVVETKPAEVVQDSDEQRIVAVGIEDKAAAVEDEVLVGPGSRSSTASNSDRDGD